MIYKVMAKFADLQDSVNTKSGRVYHIYYPGDIFPREGKDTSEDRIEALASSNNAQGRPLIAPLFDTPQKDSERQKRIADVSEKLTKKELLEIADEYGIKVPSRATKADIVELFQNMGE